MALLGFLAAGAAMGARDASNNSVRAQNELELSRARNGMEMDREALRMKYEEKRYQQQREDAKEAGKAKMAFEEAKYNRTREDRKADKETEYKMKMDLEGLKESGRNSRFSQRQALLRENAKSGGSESGSSKGIKLSNGETFTPSSPEYRLAADMVRAGDAPDINAAIRVVISKGLVSQAAGSIQGITEGTVPTARSMSGELFGNKGGAANPQELIRSFNPKTGKFE